MVAAIFQIKLESFRQQQGGRNKQKQNYSHGFILAVAGRVRDRCHRDAQWLSKGNHPTARLMRA
jgi:hypothetical protein